MIQNQKVQTEVPSLSNDQKLSCGNCQDLSQNFQISAQAEKDKQRMLDSIESLQNPLNQSQNNLTEEQKCLEDQENNYRAKKEVFIQESFDVLSQFPPEFQQRILRIIDPKIEFSHSEKDFVFEIIVYLIEHSDRNEQSIPLRQKEILCMRSPRLEMILKVFEQKFALMIKSKEEMVKFCMRKAFKYVSEKVFSESNQKLKKDQQKVLRNKYFGNQSDLMYALPFRGDSTEKTMNDEFLRKIFSLQNFIEDYKEFLLIYDEILEKDNQIKIISIVEQICELKDHHFEEELQKIKRIPWSRQTLLQTKQLAVSLLQKYGNEEDIYCKFQTVDNLQEQRSNYQIKEQNNLLQKSRPQLTKEEFKQIISKSSSSTQFQSFLSLIQKEYNFIKQTKIQGDFKLQGVDFNLKNQKQGLLIEKDDSTLQIQSLQTIIHLPCSSLVTESNQERKSSFFQDSKQIIKPRASFRQIVPNKIKDKPPFSSLKHEENQNGLHFKEPSPRKQIQISNCIEAGSRQSNVKEELIEASICNPFKNPIPMQNYYSQFEKKETQDKSIRIHSIPLFQPNHIEVLLSQEYSQSKSNYNTFFVNEQQHHQSQFQLQQILGFSNGAFSIQNGRNPFIPTESSLTQSDLQNSTIIDHKNDISTDNLNLMKSNIFLQQQCISRNQFASNIYQNHNSESLFRP